MATPNLVFCESSKNGDGDGCDFGFVFIEKGLEGRITDDDDDDDSYDYCEDVCSMLSNTYNEQECRDDCSLLSESSDDDLSSPMTGLKDSILTVPSVLMKDLDEAHAAAKMIRITDPEENNDLVDTVPAGDDKESNERHELQLYSSLSSNENTLVGDITTQDSSSLAVFTASDKTPIPAVDDRSTGRTIIFLSPAQHEIPTDPSSNETTSRLLLSKQASSKESNTKNTYSSSTSNHVSMSRTSNKKRRKKQKMLKKAQAATAAAERVQQQAPSANLCSSSPGKTTKIIPKRTSSSSPKKQLSMTPSRCASKKAANIAVSCAIETMAIYRDELSRQQGKLNQQQGVGS